MNSRIHLTAVAIAVACLASESIALGAQCSSAPQPPKHLPGARTPPARAPAGGGGGYKGPAGGRGGVRAPSPSSPGFGGPSPATPRPAIPKPAISQPYTLNGKEVDDEGAWQLWWDFNKDVYLGLDSIKISDPQSRGSDFFLGHGEVPQGARGGRATQEQVEKIILPGLYAAAASGGSEFFASRTMLAIAKVGRDGGYPMAESLMRNFLKKNYIQEDRLAALSLGVLESPEAYPLLRGLAFDSAAGREVNNTRKVGHSVRAFAAYGLGLLGRSVRNEELKSTIVQDLVLLLEAPESSKDLTTAAMISLGLVRLEVQPEAYVCACGTCKIEGPETSLQSQVTYLMRYFTAKREFSDSLRAHAATALARLMEGQPEEDLFIIKDAISGLLVRALDRSSGEPAVVRESCVLALGLLGDADWDVTDQNIRWALNRSVAGSYLERRFALISLALVGSRAGSGEQPFSGTSDVRNHLLHHLKSGRKTMRPWAALSLGVFGHWLEAANEDLSPLTGVALRAAIRNSNRPLDLGAFALAAGMRRDQEAAEIVRKKMTKVRDLPALAYAATGLGMIGNRESVELLQEMLRDTKRFSKITSSVGLALGMLGDTEIVSDLIGKFTLTESDDERAGYVAALGGIGDARCIELLVDTLKTADRPSAVREAAAVALGWVGDRRALPWRTALVRGTNYASAPESLTNSKRTGVLDLP